MMRVPARSRPRDRDTVPIRSEVPMIRPALVLSLFALVGLGGPTPTPVDTAAADPSGAVVRLGPDLYANAQYLWKGDSVLIRVSWENPAAAPAERAHPDSGRSTRGSGRRDDQRTDERLHPQPALRCVRAPGVSFLRGAAPPVHPVHRHPRVRSRARLLSRGGARRLRGASWSARRAPVRQAELPEPRQAA